MPQKFDMSAAWNDTMVLVRQDRGLIATVFGVFVFLPQLAFGWYFASSMPPIATGGPPEAMVAQLMDLYRSLLPFFLLMTLFSILANLAVLHLWLGARGTSVGAALAAAAKQLPLLILTFVMLGLAGGVGGLLIGLPIALMPTALGLLLAIGLMIGLFYLTGRLSPLFPLLVVRRLGNPVALVRDTWTLTQGNGWRCVGFMLLIQIPGLIILLLISGVTSLGGAMFSGLVGAVAQTALSILMLAVSAAIYRQLSGAGRADVFS